MEYFAIPFGDGEEVDAARVVPFDIDKRDIPPDRRVIVAVTYTWYTCALAVPGIPQYAALPSTPTTYPTPDLFSSCHIVVPVAWTFHRRTIDAHNSV